MKQDTSTKHNKTEQPGKKGKSPLVGVEPVVRHKNRLLNIMVERKCEEAEIFSDHIIVALREYANALEQHANEEPGEARRPEIGYAIHDFHSSNKCSVRVIHGSEHV